MHPTDIAKKIKTDIDAYCEETYNDPEPRKHLGASLIGHDCTRYLWYSFRWFRHKKHPAMTARLFNRGHREESRMQDFMRAAGFKLRSDIPPILHYHPESDSYFYATSFDPGDGLISDVTGHLQHEERALAQGVKKPQERIEDHNGHFGGSVDDLWEHPEYGQGIAEFKTSGTGAKKFGDLLERGVRLAKPQHWAQMCVYGFKLGLKYAVYLCINKNDDDLHVEFTELDDKLGLFMLQRAGDIINSQTPPERIASTPSHWQCKFCEMAGPCWQQELPVKNCRSCVNAVPRPNKEWGCKLAMKHIPAHVIPVGCVYWKPIA